MRAQPAYSLLRPAGAPKNRPGWAGAGVGIGMLWGGGTPLIENENKIRMFKFL